MLPDAGVRVVSVVEPTRETNLGEMLRGWALLSSQLLDRTCLQGGCWEGLGWSRRANSRPARKSVAAGRSSLVGDFPSVAGESWCMMLWSVVTRIS